MDSSQLGEQINKSFRWSTFTEILVKVLSPVLNAVLAHILLPEAFAPLTIINIVVTFGEVFVESGFKKYLIQHNFADEDEYSKFFDVAFWSNLFISLLVWGLIVAFCKPISSFLGNGDIWLAVAISGLIVPLFSICGIFNAKLQKNLEFNKLFVVRFVTALIPLFVTIPLALLGFDYWSLVIGNIASIFIQAIVLSIVGKHRIHLFFSFKILKEMLNYGVWTLLDGIAIWLTAWIDSLIIAQYMSDYYLGLYKNSLSMVIRPVLFVGLSKYQNDNEAFSKFYNSTQVIAALFLVPMGVGLFIYGDTFVKVVFGSGWEEAANIVGIVSLTTALRTIYVSICSDAYRAKGKFKIPLILQLIDALIIIPVCIISVKKGFWTLVYARALIKLDLIIPEFIIMHFCLKIDIKEQLIKNAPIYLASIVMALFCYTWRYFLGGLFLDFASIFIAILIYFGILLVIPLSRKILVNSKLGQKLFKKRKPNVDL